uniref:START domain-containing protein n=1 Tax=Coccolithus braarudii TaxID=221442 RepID=A0A7S0LCX1_9EUKA
MKTFASLRTANKEHAQPPDWSLSEGARRNSLVSFAEKYDGLSPEVASPKPELVSRRSLTAVTGDASKLNEIKGAMTDLLNTFDEITDMSATKGSDGIYGKYAVTPAGDFFLLNKAEEVQCPASKALDLLWDHSAVTVAKLWKDLIDHCDVKAELSPFQRLLHVCYSRPTLGIAQNTSARDTAVIATKSAHGNLPMITYSSVHTTLIPEQEGYVRGEAKVFGIVVKPLTDKTCSLFLGCEFAMHGGFDEPYAKCLMKCSGIDKAAARNCSLDANKALKRIKTVLELQSGSK